MLLRPRARARLIRNLLKLLLLTILLITLWDLLTTHRSPALASSPPDSPDTHLNPRNEKIFIASIHWTSESILRQSWAPTVAALARVLGPENVYVSILESGSFDATKDVLRMLDEDLTGSGIPHRIVLDERTHRDEVDAEPKVGEGWVRMPEAKWYRENWTGWFEVPEGRWVPRRIPYLARLREEVMGPLREEARRVGGWGRADRVVWLNDVVFDTNDVFRLLNTRDGDYAAACALDFKHPPHFYDTFALRDLDGHAPLTDTYPYFRSPASRHALQHHEPVPVSSCWNGMAIFDAAPFYDNTLTNHLTFRGIADDLATEHLEGSECCLIHADNPMSATKGVWVNPDVRVTYNTTTYDLVNGGAAWPTYGEIVVGTWRNRVARWVSAVGGGGGVRREKRETMGKVARWRMQDADRHREVGSRCLIDEMQIMLWNGWGHA